MMGCGEPEKGATVLLRDGEFGDVDAYLRMRCDPVMMADLPDGPDPTWWREP